MRAKIGRLRSHFRHALACVLYGIAWALVSADMDNSRGWIWSGYGVGKIMVSSFLACNLGATDSQRYAAKLVTFCYQSCRLQSAMTI